MSQVRVEGSGAFTTLPGPDEYVYNGPGQVMMREDASEQRQDKDILVTWAIEKYGERDYWTTLLSDRTLAIMAKRVRAQAQEALSSQFGHFESTDSPFVWSETHALQNLLFSVERFANANSGSVSRELLAEWWRDLTWTVAQVYADNVRQGLLYKRQLTEGPVNPGLVARPRVSDSAAGHRELNTAPYVLSHPWGHGGNFPLR